MSNLMAIIQQQISDFNEDGWNGYLYRAGGRGIFYHTSALGASFYGKDVKKYEPPNATKVMVIDIDADTSSGSRSHIGLNEIGQMLDMTVDEILEYDLAIAIEDAMPIIREEGYDAVVIVGETGSDVYGDPVEVVSWDTLKEIPMTVEDISSFLD